MAEANLVNTTSVLGKTISGTLTAGQSISLTNNFAAATKVNFLVKSVVLSSTDTASAIPSDQVCRVQKDTFYILYDAFIPHSTSLVVINETTPMYLADNGEKITVTNVSPSLSLTYVISYSEIRET